MTLSFPYKQETTRHRERELDRDKKRLVIESTLNTLTIIDRQALSSISIDIDPLLYRDTVDKT